MGSIELQRVERLKRLSMWPKLISADKPPEEANTWFPNPLSGQTLLIKTASLVSKSRPNLRILNTAATKQIKQLPRWNNHGLDLLLRAFCSNQKLIRLQSHSSGGTTAPGTSRWMIYKLPLKVFYTLFLSKLRTDFTLVKGGSLWSEDSSSQISLCLNIISSRASQVALPVVKNLPANAGDIRDVGLILRLGRSPGGGHGNPLQHSCLENPTDRGAWQATVHRVTKSQMTEAT